MMELAKKMGHQSDWPWQDVAEMLDYLLKPINMTYPELKQKGIVSIPRRYRKYEEKGFKTTSGKIELNSEILKQKGYEPLPIYREPPESPFNAALAQKYPLILITGGRLPVYNHTEMRNIPWLREIVPEPYMEIHPDTAQKRGIKQNEWVRVESPRGKIKVQAKLTLGIAPQVVRIPERWWYPEIGPPTFGWKDVNVNILTSSDPPFDPALGSWSTRVLLCEVKKAEGERGGNA
jgi:anaerobic selenocysteine-containing dehydrogenase